MSYVMKTAESSGVELTSSMGSSAIRWLTSQGSVKSALNVYQQLVDTRKTIRPVVFALLFPALGESSETTKNQEARVFFCSATKRLYKEALASGFVFNGLSVAGIVRASANVDPEFAINVMNSQLQAAISPDPNGQLQPMSNMALRRFLQSISRVASSEAVLDKALAMIEPTGKLAQVMLPEYIEMLRLSVQLNAGQYQRVADQVPSILNNNAEIGLTISLNQLYIRALAGLNHQQKIVEFASTLQTVISDEAFVLVVKAFTETGNFSQLLELVQGDKKRVESRPLRFSSTVADSEEGSADGRSSGERRYPIHRVSRVYTALDSTNNTSKAEHLKIALDMLFSLSALPSPANRIIVPQNLRDQVAKATYFPVHLFPVATIEQCIDRALEQSRGLLLVHVTL